MNTTDIIVYAWNQSLHYEVEGHFTIPGNDEDGKVRARIGEWITKVINGEAEDLQLESRPRVPALPHAQAVLDAASDPSAD